MANTVHARDFEESKPVCVILQECLQIANSKVAQGGTKKCVW